jgi:cation diffusion facilitator CzcD-associated flavoprotein CzcO
VYPKLLELNEIAMRRFIARGVSDPELRAKVTPDSTEGLGPVRVFGADGFELSDAWRDRMQAYLGTAVAGFPNLFLVIGPNTGLGHNSMIFMMEAQYRYILGAIAHIML